MLPQWATIEPVPMEGIERTNVVVIREQGQRIEAPRRDLYVMEVDRGRNCYACGGFGHIVQYYRNRGQRNRVVEERRLEYGGRREGNHKHLDDLKEVENPESLN